MIKMVGDPLHVPKCHTCGKAMGWTPRGRFFCKNLDCKKCDKKYKEEMEKVLEILHHTQEMEIN